MFEWREWMKRRAEAMRIASNKLPIPTKFVTRAENSSMPRRIQRFVKAGVNELEAQHKELSELFPAALSAFDWTRRKR